ncbi:MAG: hypothetical protein CL677_04305, partial [Bdellovibrionaceae bacterium]|nr:hypothetical protein [Pseudobdellovibrionaceae bacterium]
MKSWLEYSDSEKAEVSQWSSACERYMRFLTGDKANLDPLKEKRHHRWLDAAFATFFKTAPTSQVVQSWSRSSLEILTEAFNEVGLNEEPVAVFALGKLGSLELNLSSDVDLIWVSDKPAGPAINKKIQKLNQRLSLNNEFGFCFRLDYDLRPGGRFGPLVTSLSQMVDYYWSQGATWERIALIRLLPVTGDQHVIDETLALTHRFVFRKYADYNLLESLQSQRSKIRDYYGYDPEKRDQTINLKLDPGGIRDIELFLHVHLILHGGREPHLISAATETIASNLETSKLIAEATKKTLTETYWKLRHIENLVQLENDRQTHVIDKTNRTSLEKQDVEINGILSLFDQVNAVVSTLLGEITSIDQSLPEPEEKQIELLSELGFSEKAQKEIWPKLIGMQAQSADPIRDESYRKQVLFRYLHHLAENSQKEHSHGKDMALNLFAEFLRNIRAKASFFAFLLKQDKLLKDLAFLFSRSPYLGQLVASRPEILDSYVFKNTSELSLDENIAYDQMAETKQLTELIHCQDFLLNQDVASFNKKTSQLAESITKHLRTLLGQKFEQDGLSILCLGKWGGRELGIHSDLDFIFVTEDSPTPSQMKFARRFIARLTDVQRGGRLYSVDLRLRPSGQSGPLITSKSKLLKFLSEQAPAWLRQSYLRARDLDGQDYTQDLLKTAVAKDLTDAEIIEL